MKCEKQVFETLTVQRSKSEQQAYAKKQAIAQHLFRTNFWDILSLCAAKGG